MTPADFKILGTIAALLLILVQKRAAAAPATGDVQLGTPFVMGGYAEQLDNQGYYSDVPAMPADGVGGSSQRMQDLINQSTAVIQANGGYPQ